LKAQNTEYTKGEELQDMTKLMLLYLNTFMLYLKMKISVIITSRVPSALYVSESSSLGFSVKRVNKKFYRKEYIEFDYFVVGERKDIKI